MTVIHQQCTNYHQVSNQESKLDYHSIIPQRTLTSLQNLHTFPHCIVFDVDDTLLQGDTECTDGPPFRPGQAASHDQSVSSCYDKNGSKISVFPDTLHILAWLKHMRNFDLTLPDQVQVFLSGDSSADTSSLISNSNPHHSLIAYASRTYTPKWMKSILTLLKLPDSQNLDSLADHKEIYPGDKKQHLRRIAKSANCQLSQLLFFDNEMRNIHSAQELGVPSHYVPNGINWDQFVTGLKKYQAFKQ